jgi:gluconate 2-dehydrogenase gamma chain
MEDPSRRHFLHRGTLLAGASLLTLHGLPLRALAEQAQKQQGEGTPWRNLSDSEAATLAAVADQIYPPDDSPGASDIGVVYFIDSALQSHMKHTLVLVQSGLKDLDKRAAALGSSFTALPFEQQTPIIEQIEATGFFDVVHTMTLWGLFAMPQYGGNKDGLGWRQLGFERLPRWNPPFGYYDATHGEAKHHAGT